MPITRVRSRAAWLGAALAFLGVALAIRAAVPLGSRPEQMSGTALYAAMTYAGALVLLPRLPPFAAGGIALAWCWGAELFQLTGIPAVLSAKSLAARLVLGSSFDPVDLLWYPLGVVPLMAAHLLSRRDGADKTRSIK
jgi:drug/metabolite transporter (DMT)-like permease